MCCFRQVRRVYRLCGHTVALPDEEVKCVSPRCKFSLVHPKTCTPPQCKNTCSQYRISPQQYEQSMDGICPMCRQR